MSELDQRQRGEGPSRRMREVLWLTAIVVLLLLLVVSIAPDRLRAAIPRAWARVWPIHRATANTGDLGGGLPGNDQRRTIHTVADSTPLAASTSPSEEGGAGTKGRQKSAKTFQSSTATGDGTIEISNVESSLVRSPEYLLISGTAKPFVPRFWVQISVTFSTLRNFDRLAIHYEINNGKTVFNDAIVHAHLPRMDNAVAVAYLVPARARNIRSGGLLDSFQGVQITFFDRGVVQAVEMRGRSVAGAESYENGFLRPRSLTPFAPLAWDAFVPDSGYAEPVDLGEPPGATALTKTSPGK